MEQFWPILQLLVTISNKVDRTKQLSEMIRNFLQRSLYSNNIRYANSIGYKSFLLELVGELSTYLQHGTKQYFVTSIIRKALKNNLLAKYHYDPSKIKRHWFYPIENAQLDIIEGKVTHLNLDQNITIVTEDNINIIMKLGNPSKKLNENSDKILQLISEAGT